MENTSITLATLRKDESILILPARRAKRPRSTPRCCYRRARQRAGRPRENRRGMTLMSALERGTGRCGSCGGVEETCSSSLVRVKTWTTSSLFLGGIFVCPSMSNHPNTDFEISNFQITKNVAPRVFVQRVFVLKTQGNWHLIKV